MKLPNVSIQIISFPPAISYTVNISALMSTQQQVSFSSKYLNVASRIVRSAAKLSIPLQKWAAKQILDISRRPESTVIKPENRDRNKKSARTVFLTDMAVTFRPQPGWTGNKAEGPGHHFPRDKLGAEKKTC